MNTQEITDDAPTEWIVITGAPCAGKTTLIEELGNKGYECCPEAAARFFQSLRLQGKTNEDIVQNRIGLVQEITRIALEQEALLHPKSPVFLDRSSVDTLAYCRAFAIEDIPFIAKIQRKKFSRVLLLDRLPLTADRTETEAEAGLIEKYLFEEYTKLGHDVIRIPVLNIADRVRLVTGILGFSNVLI